MLGTPGRSRTCDLLLRRQALYSTELRAPERSEVYQICTESTIIERMRSVRKIILGCSIGSAIALATVTFALQVINPKLPPPFHSPSANNRPQVIPRPDGAELHLPEGFGIDVYAEGFERPRFMLQGPSNEILLSDSSESGSVYALLDKNQDFKTDTKQKLIGDLDRPYGLALWKDYLYIAEATRLKRYRYDAQRMTLGPGEELVSMKDFDKGHWTRTVLFDREGAKMYLTIGSGSNVSTGEDPRRAAINSYNPDGTGHQIFAAGLRNVIGLRWYPGTDVLWAAVQERDGLGDDLVPDYLAAVEQGGFYGWPYAYLGPNEDPRNKGQQPELVKKTLVPDVFLGAHVAVFGFTLLHR